MSKLVVCGGGGFIGGHLVRYLRGLNHEVRAVDIKPIDEWQQVHADVDNLQLDLRQDGACRQAVSGMDAVYNLACDMGGMGFIEHNKALCMISVLINTHLLMAARDAGVPRFFYASSACVYNAEKQQSPDVTP